MEQYGWSGKSISPVDYVGSEVLEVTWLTLKVSGTATLVSVLAYPGTALALSRFPGRNFLVSLSNSGWACRQ